jgi:hypothetical protein
MKKRESKGEYKIKRDTQSKRETHRGKQQNVVKNFLRQF